MREKQRDRAMIENPVMMSIHTETHAERSKSCVHRVGTQKERPGPVPSRGSDVVANLRGFPNFVQILVEVI